MARRTPLEELALPVASPNAQPGNRGADRFSDDSITDPQGERAGSRAGSRARLLTAGVQHRQLDEVAGGFCRMLEGHHPGRRLQAGNAGKYDVEGSYDL